ncbi:hypothetical protein, partial [Motilimonas sp. E26]|uniref:hypothetical protein n=1 Tax=Motilimonas sp. E26 TaxID=2865674 RepID=UPI001E4061DE
MGQIQHIHLNRVEVKLTDTDDPLAAKISWEPANPGGTNFKAQKLIQTNQQIVITKTIGAMFFALVFTIPGLVAAVIASPYYFITGELFLGFFLLIWGAMFSSAGFFVLHKGKKFTLDKAKGIYFRGKAFDDFGNDNRSQQGYLKDIHAIQLIAEHIRTSSSNGSPSNYMSYEMNLVLKDGERVNIMDHGKGQDVDESAQRLGEFLAVPIWKAQF